ncbi:hypothetical protein B0H34DRAFT_180427 [Crassisporium funariophilum]|nr:hypothetical protein B0H34DRAFT_180427 [Crassisporium funariophilum]
MARAHRFNVRRSRLQTPQGKLVRSKDSSNITKVFYMKSSMERQMPTYEYIERITIRRSSLPQIHRPAQLSQVLLQHLLHIHAQPPQSGAVKNTISRCTTAPTLRLTNPPSSSRDKRRLHPKIIPRQSISAPINLCANHSLRQSISEPNLGPVV